VIEKRELADGWNGSIVDVQVGLLRLVNESVWSPVDDPVRTIQRDENQATLSCRKQRSDGRRIITKECH
jgi:hypothetical protein